MKKLCLSFIIFNILLSQCDNVSEYVCQLNPKCEWFSEVKEGACSELNQVECQNGQYHYCYWNYGYGAQGDCSGGNYTMINGYCMDADNVINDFVDNVAIRGLSTLLKASGFKEVYEDNATKFILDERNERFIISYDDIHINPNGFEIDGLGFYVGAFRNVSDTGYDVKPDISASLSIGSITMDLSLDQLLYLIEQIIYDENLGKLSSFNISSKNIQVDMYQDSRHVRPLYDLEDYMDDNRYSEMSYSLEEANFSFDGYINQKMIEDIDDGILPDINQSLKFFIKNFMINKLIGLNGEDHSKNFDFAGIFSSRILEDNLLKIEYCNIEAEYLPQNNKIQFLFDIEHPFIGFKSVINSGISINYHDPEDSKWNSAYAEFELRYKFPEMIDLNLDKIIDIYGQEEIITNRLPNVGNLGLSLQYDNLQSSIDEIKEGNINPRSAILNIIGSGKLNLNGNLKNMALSIVEINSFTDMLENNRYGKTEYDYINLNVDSFSADANIQRNNVNLTSKLYTNLFKAELNGDIDIYDTQNPWVNKLNLNIYNVNDIVMDYIRIIEKEGRVKIENNAYNNDINISIYGNLKNPQIRGIGPVDR